jgi:hypothetical protein
LETAGVGQSAEYRIFLYRLPVGDEILVVDHLLSPDPLSDGLGPDEGRTVGGEDGFDLVSGDEGLGLEFPVVRLDSTDEPYRVFCSLNRTRVNGVDDSHVFSGFLDVAEFLEALREGGDGEKGDC